MSDVKIFAAGEEVGARAKRIEQQTNEIHKLYSRMNNFANKLPNELRDEFSQLKASIHPLIRNALNELNKQSNQQFIRR